MSEPTAIEIVREQQENFIDNPWMQEIWRLELRNLHAAVEREATTQARWHAVVKSICEEWNEDCDPGCDQYHTPTCKAVNIAEAKRALRERAEAAEARAERLVGLLRRAHHSGLNVATDDPTLWQDIDAALREKK